MKTNESSLTTYEKVIEVKCEVIPVLGGDTYWVKTTDWPDEYRALCWRKRSNGTRCVAIAGRLTDHPGVGACYSHEICPPSQKAAIRITNGREAKKTMNSLKQRIDKFVAEDQNDLFDLTKELATLRVLFQEMVAEYDTVEDKAKGLHIRRMTEMINSIRGTVEGISKIQSRNALTAAHVAYLRATVADILIQSIDDPKRRELAVKTLVQRIAGGENGDDRNIIKIAQEF